MSAPPFADRLAGLVEARQSQLCLGLDPAGADAGEAAAECERLISVAAAACVAVKPQLACFERHGSAGWSALERVAEAARDAGLLVVADGKRGDVPHTAAVYAEALFASGGGLQADAATINPLLGGDTIDPFVDAAEVEAAGLFTLVLTSNPGAGEVLELETGGETVAEHIAALVADRSGRLLGECGLSGMGAVVGATKSPERIGRLRRLMPSAIFLMPGMGAQGGSAEALASALGSHPASILVPVSRSIAGAPDPAEAAESLRAELWSQSSR
jgi:orotidine-5'-phosphate decarboxylase